MDRVREVVLVCTPDIQGVYVNGELVEQSEQLSIELVLEAIGCPFRSHYLSSPCNPSVRRKVLPLSLDRVVLEEDVYVSAPGMETPSPRGKNQNASNV